MAEDLKWSNYDFTKIPLNDIVSVGQRTLLYRDIFTVAVGYLVLFVITGVATVGLTQEVTKDPDPPAASQLLMNLKTSKENGSIQKKKKWWRTHSTT